MEISLKLEPFPIPTHAILVGIPQPRQDGFVPRPQLDLKQIPLDVLDKMCDEYRERLFKSVDAEDPRPKFNNKHLIAWKAMKAWLSQLDVEDEPYTAELIKLMSEAETK